jgi:hypothetical protein
LAHIEDSSYARVGVRSQGSASHGVTHCADAQRGVMMHRKSFSKGWVGVQLVALLMGGTVLGLSSSASATTLTWTTLQSEAVAAIASHDSAGAVSSSALEVGASSSIPFSAGAKSVVTASFSASDLSGSYVVVLSLIGNTQLLVDLIPSNGVGQTTALELAPGTSNVLAVTLSTTGFAPVGNTPSSVKPLARPNLSDGNCGVWISTPAVEPSIYGQLIYGEAGTYNGECPDSSINILVNLEYWNGTEGVSLDETQGASGDPETASVDATSYFPCVSGGPAWFETAALYQASGQPLVGQDSSYAHLSCET